MTNTPHTLHSLQHELARVHRTRLARRRTIATAAVALPALALVFVLFPSSGGTGIHGGTGFQPVTPVAASLPPSPLEGEGPPKAGERGTSLASTPNTDQGSSLVIIETMTDEELLAALSEAGQPSGLITINGHTTVVANRFPDAPSPFAPFRASINAAP